MATSTRGHRCQIYPYMTVTPIRRLCLVAMATIGADDLRKRYEDDEAMWDMELTKARIAKRQTRIHLLSLDESNLDAEPHFPIVYTLYK